MGQNSEFVVNKYRKISHGVVSMLIKSPGKQVFDKEVYIASL